MLGVLLLCQSLPAERHRRSWLCRLRPAGALGKSKRDEEKGIIAWRIKFRNGKKDMDLVAPITTKPWGTGIPELSEVPGPTQEQRDSQLLYNEPKYIRLDEGGLHTLESNGLKMKAGVYY